MRYRDGRVPKITGYVDVLYAVVERLELLGQLLAHPEEHSACPYQGIGSNATMGIEGNGVVCTGLAAAKVGNITTLGGSCTDASS